MTEDKQDKKDKVVHRIPLKRHLWSDEIQARKQEKKIKRLKIAVAAVLIAGIFIGWLGGSLLPYSFMRNFRNEINSGRITSQDKLKEVLNTMENDWYFGKDINDLDSRLTDQAITGITTNSEDTHTEYMSEEQMDAFVQSINRNYTGIGVQFVHNQNMNIITRIFHDSPAEKAGLQVGDIIRKVGDHEITDESSDDIKNYIQGEAGSEMDLTIERNNTLKTFTLVRQSIASTVWSEQIDEHTLYLQIAQFGNSTSDEVKKYLDQYTSDDKINILLDLRDDGGGYLEAAKKVLSLFLPDHTLFMKEEYRDGSVDELYTEGDPYTNIGKIVILVNQNTASAAEITTAALKSQRDDVTIVGTTTYGKGTVQVTKQFKDGSALKYTNARWLTPEDTWINGAGITPDVEVKLAAIFTTSLHGMTEDEQYAYDSVGTPVMEMQLCLQALGYDVDRTDEYFSAQTRDSLIQYEKDHHLNEDGILTAATYQSLISTLYLNWDLSHDLDTQYKQGLEVLNGRS